MKTGELIRFKRDKCSRVWKKNRALRTESGAPEFDQVEEKKPTKEMGKEQPEREGQPRKCDFKEGQVSDDARCCCEIK